VIFWSPWISLAECSRSSFALVVFCVQVRTYFLLLPMLTRVVSGKSKPMRAGLRTMILRLRVPMDGILFSGKGNVLTVERNCFRKLWFNLVKQNFCFKPPLWNQYINLSCNNFYLNFNIWYCTYVCWLCSCFAENCSSWSWRWTSFRGGSITVVIRANLRQYTST
jgi:hypothetical protein